MTRSPATTSLAVWDMPAAVAVGDRFTVKVGVKSSAGCDLRDRAVAIRDAAGAVIGEGRLGATPWPGTEALYWTELSLPAPAAEGVATLTAHFAGGALQPPHTDASATISLAAVKPPDHTLAITLVEKDSGKALKGAALRLGAYRTSTDENGAATVRVAKGSYRLEVWKAGYDAPPTAVDVAGDRAIRIEAVVVPEENVDRAWKG